MIDEQKVRARATIPDQARVVIVGGGVIGASIAYHLCKLGWRDVVLLERRELTAGTTWHAAGLITSAGMASETLLWMARYTRDLCVSLEAETGQATGFRPIGHIHLATTPQRLETLRREATFVRGFGVVNEEISAAEFAGFWPAAKTDDVLAGFYVPDEGRANPADLTQAFARGARMNGAQIIEGVTVTGITQANGYVTGVETDQGPIKAEFVVNAAGMWGREVGALAGVSVPLQAAEHYYLITDTVDWAHPDLPVVEDPDLYGYYREEGGGILVGMFEPQAASWSLDKVPPDVAFASLQPDWGRVGPYIDGAMERFPSLREAGVRTMFCGPESFTPDMGPQLGEAPELRNFFVAAGLNSLGILYAGGVGSLTAAWIADGVPPVDVSGLTVDRTQLYETSRRFRKDRAVEQLGAAFGDAAFPTWHPWSARNVRRSVVHDRMAADGAYFAVSSGWEYAEWFDPDGIAREVPQGWGRNAGFDLQAAEHRAVREAVGVLDMSIMAKFMVQGRDAETVLNRVCANDVSVPVGRIVYTQWLNEAGGIIADLTVTRLAETTYLLVTTDLIHRRMAPWIQRHTRDGEFATVTDVTAGTTLLTVQGPAVTRAARGPDQRRPVQRRLPVHDGPGDRPRLRPGPRDARHLRRRAGLGAPCARGPGADGVRRAPGGRPGRRAPERGPRQRWAACDSRRPTATSGSTSTTRTRRSTWASGSRWRWTSRAGSSAGRRCCGRREAPSGSAGAAPGPGPAGGSGAAPVPRRARAARRAVVRPRPLGRLRPHAGRGRWSGDGRGRGRHPGGGDRRAGRFEVDVAGRPIPGPGIGAADVRSGPGAHQGLTGTHKGQVGRRPSVTGRGGSAMTWQGSGSDGDGADRRPDDETRADWNVPAPDPAGGPALSPPPPARGTRRRSALWSAHRRAHRVRGPRRVHTAGGRLGAPAR